MDGIRRRYFRGVVRIVPWDCLVTSLLFNGHRGDFSPIPKAGRAEEFANVNEEVRQDFVCRRECSGYFNVYPRVFRVALMEGVLRRSVRHCRQGTKFRSAHPPSRRFSRNRQVFSSQRASGGFVTLLCRIVLRCAFVGPTLGTARSLLFFYGLYRVFGG